MLSTIKTKISLKMLLKAGQNQRIRNMEIRRRICQKRISFISIWLMFMFKFNTFTYFVHSTSRWILFKGSLVTSDRYSRKTYMMMNRAVISKSRSSIYQQFFIQKNKLTYQIIWKASSNVFNHLLISQRLQFCFTHYLRA